MFQKLVAALSIVVHRASLSAYCAAVLLMTPCLLADARAQAARDAKNLTVLAAYEGLDVAVGTS